MLLVPPVSKNMSFLHMYVHDQALCSYKITFSEYWNGLSTYEHFGDVDLENYQVHRRIYL